MARGNHSGVWGALACVVLVLALVVWWSGSESDGTRDAGKQGTVTSQGDSRGSLGAWLRSWGSSQSSPSAAGEPKDVEEAVRKIFRAYNRQDLPAFKAGWTDGGFQRAYERPKEKVRDFGRLSLLSFRPYTIGEFSNTSVNGESATTEVELTYGEVQESHRMMLLREGDRWKIDQDEKLDVVPQNTTVVDVSLQHFNIRFDRSRLAPGNVAFKISNTDTQQHEFIVKKIAESESEDTVGMTKPLKPGENETLVLSLDAGRYVALCNMISRDGVPYSYGMRSEFTIE